MYTSKFILSAEVESTFYLFNTLTQLLVKVDKNTAQYFNNKVRRVSKSDFDSTVYAQLIDLGFLCTSPKTQQSRFFNDIRSSLNCSEYMNLTIAPTLDCPFHCFYCFEKKHTKSVIDDSTLESIISYVESKDIRRLHITWFGGEPLLAIDKLLYFQELLKSRYTGVYTMDLITTGFNIISNKEKIKELDLSSVQITLDGNETTHNSIKKNHSCSNVFKNVLEGISCLYEEAIANHVSIRVNITRNNMSEFPELYDHLKKMFPGDYVSVTPSLVLNKNDIENPTLLSLEEFKSFVLDLWYIHKIPTYWIDLKGEDSICASLHCNTIVVDHNGNLYNCWEVLGDSNHIIGNLDSVNFVNLQNLGNKYISKLECDSECSNCSFLPLCFGGCPLEREENKCDQLCFLWKDDFTTWLKAFLDSRSKLGKIIE